MSSSILLKLTYLVIKVSDNDVAANKKQRNVAAKLWSNTLIIWPLGLPFSFDQLLTDGQ